MERRMRETAMGPKIPVVRRTVNIRD